MNARKSLVILAFAAAALVPVSVHSLPDVLPYAPSGWDYPVVPRDTGDATLTNAVLDSTALFGNNPGGLYWNVGTINQGSSTTVNNPNTMIYLEDTAYLLVLLPNLGPGEASCLINGGSGLVKGGRHTVLSWADWNNVEVESDETNNQWARQFIWSPLLLLQGSPVTRTGDPVVVSTGSGPHLNAEGFWGPVWPEFYWYAFAVLPEDSTDDFDIRLNTEHPSNIPQAGFGTWQAASMDGAGEMDFVIVNQNHAPWGLYYASALNWSGENAGNKIVEFQWDEGTIYSAGTYGPYMLGPGDLIELHDVHLFGGTPTRIHVKVLGGDADISLSVYDASLLYAAKSDYMSGGYADNNGAAGDEYVIVTPDSSGYYGVAVWKSRTADLDGAITYNLIVSEDPNLSPNWTPTGWSGPVVPRNAPDAAFGSAALPDSLSGNQATTSFNFSTYNEGAGDVEGSWLTDLYVDDVLHWTGIADTLVSGQFAQWINTAQGGDPSVVRGGRHHVRLQADVQDSVVECFEDDNMFVEWFVWTPLELSDGVPIGRDAPPDPTPLGWGPRVSCDGFRVEPAAAWTAVGILPLNPAGDPDLQMHPASSGSKDGFGASYAASYHGSGHSDFVIVNRNVAPWEPLDFGVFGFDGGNEFIVQRADGVHGGLVGASGASLGPFVIAGDHVLDFHEIEIDSSALGTNLFISLDNLAGSADLGLAIYDKNTGYFGRVNHVADADSTGDGQDEHLPPIVFFEAGSFGIAVYKHGSGDLGKSNEYRLVFSTVDLVDAPLVEAPPERFALGTPRPNPFAAESQIRYDVPAGGGHVSVAIFDIRGRRVATLVDGAAPTGRHTALWNGVDSAGRRVGSGVYFVRLESPTVREVRKITLLR